MSDNELDLRKLFPDIWKVLDELDSKTKELEDGRVAEKQKWVEENPERDNCDHGITFDEEVAKKLTREAKLDTTLDPAVAFIMGPSSSSEIRKRWPRLCGACPKGCGYNGIYYASYSHYLYGDW